MSSSIVRSLCAATSRMSVRSPTAVSAVARAPSTLPSTTLRTFSSSSANQTWGGGKLKTHQGTKKRFKAVSKRRKPARQSPILANFTGISTAEKKQVQRLAGLTQLRAPVKKVNAGARPGPLFKRGQSGKRHLNLRTSGSKLNSLGGTRVVGQGRLGWHLRKLMPYA